MIIKKKNLKQILFLDIETVSEKAKFSELSKEMQELWSKKASKMDRKEEMDDASHSAITYQERAGIFAEFAKIVCISVGYLSKHKREGVKLKIKTLGGHNETEILHDFCDLLNKHYDNPDKNFLCGHNIKEFDIPFICRRLIVNGMNLPRMLNLSGKKPWQIGHLLDTMELWKFGDYKNYTSLSLLASILQIPSPKDDIDGSLVGKTYWEENNLDRIIAYCEKDVITVAQVAMKYAGTDLIDPENIEISNHET